MFTIVGFSLNVSSNYLLSFSRRQDSSIGFGAPVRANMRTGGSTNAVVTSSLLESVRIHPIWLQNLLIFILIAFCVYIFCAMHILIPFIIQPYGFLMNLQVESSDLIAYGLIPEFVGRFPILVSLSALNEEQLVQVCSVI